MKIGLVDVDSHNFPNLPLMKISAYHKKQGDDVEFAFPLERYDKIYISKIFGEEYSEPDFTCWQADEIIYGGTGYEITVEDGREIYRKKEGGDLPEEIEHIYPDYELYPELTKDTAYGFLTRGCPNNCPSCIVSKKEGFVTRKVADIGEFWNGQKRIKLLDANLLACWEKKELLQQLIDTGASVDFTQGLDARFINEEIASMLGRIKIERVHFAFDFMKFEKKIVEGLRTFQEVNKLPDNKAIVYMLTNFDTTIQEDLYRLEKIRSLGYIPDVRIYRKNTAPKVLKDLQRWCNNRIIFRSCEFMDYVPSPDKEGKTIKQLYFGG